jgi:benzoyl-CoA reductase/2-hydroxyglutaryl-CoA dehydratase subunit BcrC/BadD/HgdB
MERLGEFLVRIGGHAPAPRELATQMHAYRALRTELASAADWCFGSAYADAIAHFHSQGSFKLPSPDKFKETATARNPEQKPRLALVGGPLDADGLRLFREIERLGGIVVLNATETGERSLAPRTPEGTGVSDAPAGEGGGSTARELSRILLEQCVDVFQRPNSRLYAWLEPRIVKRRVQGIILWHHVGCDLWRAEAESIREAFKLPLLLLEAEDTGSIDQRTISRVQAFLEALR